MESYPRFLQDVGRGRGPVPFPCTPSPDRARPKSVRNAPGLKCQGCPRPFKVLLELASQRRWEELSSWSFLRWVLSYLQLRTNSLGLLRQNHCGASGQAQRPRGVALVDANFHETAGTDIRKRLGAIALRKCIYYLAH